jgi:hypothetical protein
MQPMFQGIARFIRMIASHCFNTCSFTTAMGTLPHCQTVYAQYHILVEKMEGIEFGTVVNNFATATEQAIADGMLQESMNKIDAGSPFAVLGPGKPKQLHRRTQQTPLTGSS